MSDPTPGSTAVAGPPGTVILIRHGEKPGENGAPRGVNRHGEPDEHSLSVRGWTRAGALAGVLARSPHPDEPHLCAPSRVLATRSTDGYRSRRERDTALPTALRLGLTVDDSWEHGEEPHVARSVLATEGDVLVVWHHGRLADLVRCFPLANPGDVPPEWPADRFDLYWILVHEHDDPPAYRFLVEPQLLIDGDSP